MPSVPVSTTTDRATFGAVFADREFRALWAGQLLSLVGDQLAIVALTWLVYDWSGSALLTAATYAIGYLPWLIGGPLLSGIADRRPRREVMVACDAARVVLMLVMALAGLPIWALCTLLFVTELLSPPFRAARAALLPDILTGDRYVLATAINNITAQFGQVVGFSVSGLVVAFLAPTVALVVNAASFAVSALLLLLFVRSRPAARSRGAEPWSLFGDAAAGIRLVFGRRDLRTLTGFALLCVFYVVPEGLAAPYAVQLGGGPVMGGLILAALPAGAVVGAAGFSRWVSGPRRLVWMGPLAIGSCLPLVLCALRPGLGWSLAVFALCGAAVSYQLAANAAFVLAVPDESRGQAFGLVQALMSVGQGAAIVLAGLLADHWEPGYVLAGAGAVGTVAAAALAASWRGSLRLGAPVSGSTG